MSESSELPKSPKTSLKRSKLSKIMLTLAAIFAVFVAVAVYQNHNSAQPSSDAAIAAQNSKVNSNSSTVTAESVPSQTPISNWYPKGYAEYSDGIAVKFDNSVIGNCLSNNGCWGLRVIVRDGCASELYVEGNVLDSSGAALGITNATVGSLPATGKANLVLEDLYSGSGHKFSWSKVTCI
jgi:hypothetical protein